MKKYLLRFHLVIALLLGFVFVEAQPKLKPIRLHNKSIKKQSTSVQRTQGGSPVFVTLPFFDDFANQIGEPDTLKWQSDEGVYVNNSFGFNMHTIGVATFDGLQNSGEPYSLDALGLTGEADRLTSHCFDLSGYTANDSLRLTYYWQTQGLGELPNSEDYLKLEFLNSSGQWISQWQVNGDTLTEFAYEEFVITDPEYLHNAFQFRFVNFGRLSGGYDTWNLDYIYFNTNADYAPAIGSDFGFSNQVSDRLKGYKAIPSQHFLSSIDELWQDTISVTYRSAFREAGFNLRALNSYTIAYQSTRNDTIVASPFQSSKIGANPLETIDADFNIDQTLFDFVTEDSFTVIHTFVLDLQGGGADNEIVRTNDTLRAITIFSDYYAYDDGSAELGYGVNEKFGQIAYEFNALEDDTLRYIDIFLAQLGGQASGSFKIKVWTSIDTVGGNDEELFTTASYPILYTDGINTFQRLQLDEYVPIPQGKFYIGIEQLSDQDIMIGFDKNTDNGDKIFYNLGNKWFQNKQFSGSLMMRPVFEHPSSVVTGREEDLKALQEVIIYPNPTRSNVWVKGAVDELTLYTMTGQLIQHQIVGNRDEKSSFNLELPQLNSGIYILKIRLGDAVTARKLVVNE